MTNTAVDQSAIDQLKKELEAVKKRLDFLEREWRMQSRPGSRPGDVRDPRYR